ncbi:MAG TPA: carboxypeptidase regulatory-like domain-containing protein [Thermoanaerobaculia bacterium]|nr:carboxypeptidase regulatory-like domain-containing protein [Thermoanaerobaculia bacterium]
MVFQKFTSWRSVAYAALLSVVFVLAACSTEGPSPTEPTSDVQLFGFVRGAGGSPISNATVSVGMHTASSDATGLYRLTGLTSGSQTVTAKKSGFQDFTKTVDLDRALANQLDITLVPSGGTGVITGDVRSDNAPLAGVTIAAAGSSTTTAADGTFTLSGLTPGTVTLTAHKDGFNDVTLQVNVGESVHIVMSRPSVSPASLSGTVTGSGAPVSGVVVTAQGQTATTGADGKYSFATLISGTTAIRATKTGFATFQQNVTLASGPNTLDITLSAVSSATLSGQVTSSGTAVSGATVSAQGKTATTGTDGNYSITGLNAGTTSVSVSKSGFSTVTQSVVLTDGANTLNVTLSGSGSGTTSLSGTITTSTGGALPGATITVQSKTATSANDGSYMISDLTTGTASVNVSKIGFQGQILTVTLATGANTLNASLVAITPRATLLGTATFNGNPVSGVTVTAQGLSVVTASGGTYRFSDLSTGSSTVTAQKSGFQDLRQTVTLVTGDNTLDILLTAASGTALLSGTVASGGSAVAGVTITVRGQTAISGTDGTYLFTGLIPGSTTLTATKSGFQNFQTTVSLLSGANNFDIGLTPSTATGANLSGLVSTLDGLPIPGVTISAQSRTSISDDNGQYTITSLTPGSTIVTAQKTGFQDSRQTVTLVAGDNTLLIQMTAASGTALLSGIVTTGVDATSVSGVTVAAQGKSTVSRADGSYLLTNLTPVSTVVTATKTGFTNFSQSMNLVAGQNTLNISVTPSSTNLSGSVRKLDGTTAISGAKVTVQNISATTDVNGLYRITGLAPGTATVTVTANGFKNLSQVTTLNAGDNTLDIQMTPP